MSFGQGAATVGAEEESAQAGAPLRLSRGARVGLCLVLFWAVVAAFSLMPGALILARHEGDAMHLAAMVLRMVEGQTPHLDYLTPIGILAVAPIAGLVSVGLGLGQAFIWSQILIAAALLPVAWWVAISRFGGGWVGIAFGALVIGMTMAFVHGGTVESISISMHYNRWAWAVAFLVMALVLLPANGHARPRLEAVFLGLALTCLALTKITYAVALVPAVVLALALRRDWAGLLWGIATGLGALAAFTAFVGIGFWQAYVQDLLAVATSTSRATPGRSLSYVLYSPKHVAETLVGLVAVLALRRAGQLNQGLVLLVMLPGLILISWQNFGNDAQWLAAVALVLIAARPLAGGQAHVIAATAALALSAGWIVNLAVSPLRVAGSEVSASSPILPAAGVHADFRLLNKRFEKVEIQSPFASFGDAPETPEWGEPLPQCDLVSGGMRVFHAMSDELEEAGFSGRQMLVADTFQSFWLFGDFPTLPGGAPWYYDGLPGGTAADVIVVPLCPTNAKPRTRMLAAAEGAGWHLTEVHRGTYAVVLEIRGN